MSTLRISHCRLGDDDVCRTGTDWVGGGGGGERGGGGMRDGQERGVSEALLTKERER